MTATIHTGEDHPEMLASLCKHLRGIVREASAAAEGKP